MAGIRAVSFILLTQSSVYTLEERVLLEGTALQNFNF